MKRFSTSEYKTLKNLLAVLAILNLLLSCSHGNQHHEVEEVKDWNKEKKELAANYKKMVKVFDSLKVELKKHYRELSKEVSEMETRRSSAKQETNNIKKKMLVLKVNRIESELREEHHHFKEDYKEIMEHIDSINRIKKSLESHEGHNH